MTKNHLAKLLTAKLFKKYRVTLLFQRQMHLKLKQNKTLKLNLI